MTERGAAYLHRGITSLNTLAAAYSPEGFTADGPVALNPSFLNGIALSQNGTEAADQSHCEISFIGSGLRLKDGKLSGRARTQMINDRHAKWSFRR